MTNGKAWIAAPLALCAYGAAVAGLPKDIDGNWFDPQHAGHGITIESVGADRALVFWYVYDAEGRPTPLYVDGRIDGHTIRGSATAPRGMRFGRFDPAELQLSQWGAVEVTFTDCEHALLRYAANDPALGGGAIPIERLSRRAAPGCSLDAPDRLPNGWAGGGLRLGEPIDSGSVTNGLHGFVSGDGGFMAMFGSAVSYGSVLIAPAAAGKPGSVTLHATALPNGGLCALVERTADCAALYRYASAQIELPFVLGEHQASATVHAADPTQPELDIDVGGAVTSLPRGLTFDVRTSFHTVESRGRIEIGTDGSLCVRLAHERDCYYRGRVVEDHRTHSTFELQHGGEPVFLGNAVAHHEFLQHEVHNIRLVGSNGRTGIGLHGSR